MSNQEQRNGHNGNLIHAPNGIDWHFKEPIIGVGENVIGWYLYDNNRTVGQVLPNGDIVVFGLGPDDLVRNMKAIRGAIIE